MMRNVPFWGRKSHTGQGYRTLPFPRVLPLTPCENIPDAHHKGDSHVAAELRQHMVSNTRELIEIGYAAPYRYPVTDISPMRWFKFLDLTCAVLILSFTT